MKTFTLLLSGLGLFLTNVTATPHKANIDTAANPASSHFFGDVTHWDGGLGACGWTVNTKTSFQVSMAESMMGVQSNGNPNCGRSITIKSPNTGKTAVATLGDKCGGCKHTDLDLTDALFAAVAGECDGRCNGFEWWWN